MDNLIYFVVLALIAEILGTVGGFGSSLFFVPIAGYFLDFHAVLGITALFHVSSNISKIVLFRKGIDKRVILLIGIPAVLFVILGAYISKFFDTKILEIILSVFLIIISLIFLVFKKIILQPTTYVSITGGIFSGLFAGMVGSGGAIRGITLAAFGLSSDVFIASSAFIDLGVDLSRSIVYVLNGYVKQSDLYLIPILFVTSVLGTYIGKIILGKISTNQFKNIVLVLILMTGIITLIKQLL